MKKLKKVILDAETIEKIRELEDELKGLENRRAQTKRLSELEKLDEAISDVSDQIISLTNPKNRF